MNELDRLNVIPPYAVRLLAREPRKWKHLSCEQIAERSGLSLQAVKTISTADDWMKVRTESRILFFKGCGVDMYHLQRPLELIKRTNGLRTARHLRKALSPSNTHYKFYARLVAKMPTFV